MEEANVKNVYVGGNRKNSLINQKMICRILGFLLFIEGVMLLVCAGVSLFYHESDYIYFVYSTLITVGAGGLLVFLGRKAENKLTRRDGYCIVAFTWILFSAFGMLPFLISGAIPSVADAFFEIVSGFTTTGATILDNIESLSHGILFWRSFSHWIGGLGIVFFTIAVLPIFGVGNQVLFSSRSGVGKLALIDNDTVSVTNINRQSIAYHSTMGRYKTEVMRERVRDICPDITVETYEMFILPENIGELFESTGRPDYIIDAIDTVSAKLAIVKIAQEKDIPIISSMGTGNKLHGELFEIADISETSVCPLCRVMRKELKNRGITHLKVLYSKEKPVDTGGRSTGEDMGKRRAVPGSISFVPPVAGLLIAGETVRDLMEL